MCNWVVALYSLWRAIEKTNSNKGWWLLTAICCGIGVLSKQMMLVFLLLMLIYLLLSREDRFRLKTFWPYLTILIALAFLLPPLLWNMSNDWVTVQHTSHHFNSNRSFSDFLETFFNFVVGQLLLFSPLPVILLACLSTVFVKQIKLVDRRVMFLVVFSSLPLFVFLLMSFRQHIHANWPAVFYPSGFLLVSAWAMGSFSAGKRLNSWRRLFPAAVYSGIGLTVLTYGLVFIFSFTSLGGFKVNPLHRLRGWKQLGAQVSDLQAQRPDPGRVFLLADKRQTVSEMAFYVSGQPVVYLWPPRKDLILSQYDLWPGPEDKIGWDALIILGYDNKPSNRLKSIFRQVMPLTTLEIPLGPGSSRQYSVYLGHSLEKWPK
jgi:4-amino-4-deoxy-L-arabinose transferase-like glycosyltransferase